MAPVYNGIDWTFPTGNMSPVLNDVTQLFYDNGTSVNIADENAQIITQTNGQGLSGIYVDSTSTPEYAEAILSNGE